MNPKLSGSAQVIYVTYIGGTGDETFGAMSISATGDVFMTGSTESSNFPLQNAAQTAIGGSSGDPDAFVLWLSSSQGLLYSTYFGGSDTDTGTAIAVNASGHIWIAGDTQSTDLSDSTGFQNSLIGAQNMFLADFNPANSGIRDVALFHLHRRHALGRGFRHRRCAGSNHLAGRRHLFARHLDPGQSPIRDCMAATATATLPISIPDLGANALLYASFLGGSRIDEATSLVLDPSGNIILSGYTLSSDFPVTSSAFQTNYGGDTDAFVTVLDTAKAQLVYSTYFGGTEPDAPMDLKEDSEWRAVSERLHRVGRSPLHQRCAWRPITTTAWMPSA